MNFHELLEKEWIRGVLTFVRMGSGKWHLESLMGGLMMPSTPLDLQVWFFSQLAR